MTVGAFHVRLEKAVRGVTLNENPAPGNAVPPITPLGHEDVRAGAVPPELLAQVEQERNGLQQTHQVLDDLIVKLTRFHEDMLTSHRKEIARLAVEIARKVVMQKVKEGDYEVEQIIQEALKNAPMQQDVVVHLHPEDLVACRALQQDSRDGPLSRLQLVGDPAVGKAECLLETPKGVVKSFIEKHLDKIREALERTN